LTLQIEGQPTSESENSDNSQLQVSLIEDTRPAQERPRASSRRNPPARNTSRFWFDRFLSVIQRQNPSVIDLSFLGQIAPSNEGKLLAQLKFLKVIDDQGRATQLLPLLNLVGEEQKKGFHQMIEESYSDLLTEVKIDKAVPDDIVNFFIRKFSFSRDKAVNASKFFLYLADKSSIQISQELVSFYNEKNISSQSNGSSSPTIQVTSPIPNGRLEEKSTKASAREYRVSLKNTGGNLSQKRRRYGDEKPEQNLIHATIEIKLDKDTPREYWDRVLALLGEKRDEDELRSSDLSETQKDDAASATSSLETE